MAKRTSFRRWLGRAVVLAVLAAFGAAVWVADVAARRLIVPRRAEPAPIHLSLRDEPAKHGLRLERFTVTAADGVPLQALMVSSAAPSAGPRGFRQLVAARAPLERPGAPPRTLLLLHGINSCKEHMLAMAPRFCAAGFRCLIFDSRAHGQSGGHYATFGFAEADDCLRVLNTAESRFGPLGSVGVFGYSMGGAIGLRLSADPRVGAVAVVSTFATLEDVIRGQAAQRWNGRLTPLLPLVRLCVRVRAGFDPFHIRPVDQAARFSAPLFVVHGEKDTVISARAAEALLSAHSHGPGARSILPAAGHLDVFRQGGDPLYADLAAFFLKSLTKRSA